LSTLRYQGRDFEKLPTESVLQCLLRHGVKVNWGCTQGNCRACRLHLESGEVSETSRRTLPDTQRALGYILACRSYPHGDLALELEAPVISMGAEMVEAAALTPRLHRIRLAPASGVSYHPGQQIRVNGGPLYPLTSLPSEPWLEYHAPQVPTVPVNITAPHGDFFFIAETPPRPVILAGAGPGIAALYAVVRSVLAEAPATPVALFCTPAPAFDALFAELAAAHPAFRRQPEDAFPASLAGCRVFLSAPPLQLQPLHRRAFLAGADPLDIHTLPLSE